jgi:hypothetical protein
MIRFEYGSDFGSPIWILLPSARRERRISTYRPRQTGGRFSLKALAPSTESSERSIR